MRTKLRKWVFWVSFISAACFAAQESHAALAAADNADNYVGSGWGNGSSGGSGTWGSSWAIRSTPDGGFSDFFLASSASSNIRTPTRSWGAYGNGGSVPRSSAFRSWSGDLSIGQTFRVRIDNGFIESGGSIGVTLRTGNTTTSADSYTSGSRFEFRFQGGESTYEIVDAGATTTTVGFRSSGLTLNFTLTGVNTYDLVIRDAANSSLLQSLTGQTLGGTAGAALNSFALFVRDVGPNSMGTDDHDTYFNSVEVVPEPTNVALAIFGGLVGLWGVGRHFKTRFGKSKLRG